MVTFPPPCTILENELPYVLSSFNSSLCFPANDSSNFPLYAWIAQVAEEESKLLLRSFILNLARQDWLSNNPYMRGKRTSPGMVFVVGYFLRHAAVLSVQSNSKPLLYFVCKALQIIIPNVFKSYEDLQISRGRASQWKNDLKYFLISIEYTLTIIVNSVTQQPEMFYILTEPLKVIFDGYIALYNLLSLLQETDAAKIRSIMRSLCNNTIEPADSMSFEWYKQMVDFFIPILMCPEVSNGSLRLVLFSFVMLSDIRISDNHEEHNRDVDNLHLAKRDRFYSFIELFNFRDCSFSWKNMIPCSEDLRGMKFLLKVISKMPEIIDSSYPPLTEQQENLRNELKTYLSKTNEKTIDSYL